MSYFKKYNREENVFKNSIYDKDFGYGYIKKECEITTSNDNVTYKDPNFNIYYDFG